jgi:hypothetical protein
MIDLATLKLAIRAADPDATIEDELLQQYDAAAVAYVSMATDHYFGPPDAEAEFVVEGDGTSVLWLPELVSAVTAVTERAYLGDTAALAILTGDDDGWALRLSAGRTHGKQLIRKGGTVWARGREYVVVGAMGYAAGEEPADIRQVVLELVGKMYQFRTPIVTGTIVAELPHGARDTLARWRRIPV